MQKKQTHITIRDDTKERLLQYGYENHIGGGLSGVIEYLAWHKVKVSEEQIRGQMSLKDLDKPPRRGRSRQKKQV